jgi:hypothetical protein
MNGLRQINLPTDLCEALESRFSGRFGCLDQMVKFVLEELLRDESLAMGRSEQHMIEDRLRDLGYM